MTSKTINVVGGGILGLWQSFRLAKAGHKVSLFERSKLPFEDSSSWLAGAMLAPFCETEPSQPELTAMALEGIELWQTSPCEITQNGTLIIAPPRDRVELKGFAKRTSGFETVSGGEIERLEPDLSNRFTEGLYYKDEAHLAPRIAMATLLEAFKTSGGVAHFGVDGDIAKADITIDTRGMGAANELKELRPVRGEMAVVHAPEISLSRPVRLLHPRMPCYIVPWPDHHFMIGATVIESDDIGRVSLRSGLELLGAAFTVHPSFGEAKIIELSAGARPSLPDNLPKIIIDGDTIHVNGAYRHGFLLAPLLAERVAAYIESGVVDEELFQ